jgi:hypothetical protein
MYWGAGSDLGLLTMLGYVAFVCGLAIMWRSRADVFVWMVDELGDARRSFSRHTMVGPFYQVREESRLRGFPSYLVRSLRRIPRYRIITAGAFLLFVGPLLFALDFFL